MVYSMYSMTPVTIGLSLMIQLSLAASNWDMMKGAKAPCFTREVAFGVGNGKIPDPQLSASSCFTPHGLEEKNGRLNGSSAWGAFTNNKYQFFQVDLGRTEVVTAVATQGRRNSTEWVTAYYLSYGQDGLHFKFAKEGGRDKLFTGNNDGSTVVKNIISPAITARFIRFHPQAWVNRISMRVEVYGCERRNFCNPNPCENGGTCINKGNGFSCQCTIDYFGNKCEIKEPDPCEGVNCQNGGVCIPAGNKHSCRCPPLFGGDHCETSQSMCSAQGDAHYSSFDGRNFDFRGRCQNLFAQDCGRGKRFSVLTQNRACAGNGGPLCLDTVTAVLAEYNDTILFKRSHPAVRAVIINSVKYEAFPIARAGFNIIAPNARSITLTADIGLKVIWDSNSLLQVIVSGAFKNQTCSSALCGNNNGDWRDDDLFDKKCTVGPVKCVPTSQTRPIIDKCDLVNAPGSPFQACNAVVNPTDTITNCKDDACICQNPMECVCASIAKYSGNCAASGKVINWRFNGTYLYPPLAACAQQCKNEGEIFMECGLSCARTCRDLSSDVKCNEKCVAGCQCPSGEVLNHENRCVPISQCLCEYEGELLKPGGNVTIGNCKTCTCTRGSMICEDDGNCITIGPCESFPCLNEGICTEESPSSFSCNCTEEFQGKTCQDPKPKPCDLSPCKNGGICSNNGSSFSCECPQGYKGKTCEETVPDPCKPNPCGNGGNCSLAPENSFQCKCPNGFIGKRCEIGVPDPCKPNPCQNGGKCKPLGKSFSCRCKDNSYGGSRCEYEQGLCTASGDPHYTTFDKKKYDFQGPCSYVFAEDCSEGKAFKVVTENLKCGYGVTCTAAVTVYLNGSVIRMTRETRSVIINNSKIKEFPVEQPGFIITNPMTNWLALTSDSGLTVKWNSATRVQVAVSGKYRDKMCGLCGNFNGNKADDVFKAEPKCTLPPEGDRGCEGAAAVTYKKYMEKCQQMTNSNSPFSDCNWVVDPKQFIKDCEYDACKCDDPMQCVCRSFAAYSQACSNNGAVLEWRFKGTYLFPPLEKCAQICPYPGEVFLECGSSCARSCRDLATAIACKEECVPGCQCPSGKVLNYVGQCVPVAECPCEFGGKRIDPGKSVDVGKCTSCTCNSGAMKCVKDDKCPIIDPCDSLPCKNGGICTTGADGKSFSCKCTEKYQGETCKEPKPQPCDSYPCKNNGLCTNEGETFSCECTCDYQGPTCEELKPKPCDSSPCKNGGACANEGESFKCECEGVYHGKTCEEAKCEENKLDLLYVVDGSGSVNKTNFERIKSFIQQLNTKFKVGPQRTQIALMQFGHPSKTRVEFNLGEKNTLKDVNKAVEGIEYLKSNTATGDALLKSRKQVFNGNDRRDAKNVLILFTDGETREKNKKLQLDEAEKLKDQGVKIITVGIGKSKTIDKFRDKLRDIASKRSLMFEANFNALESIANELVKETCGMDG